MGPSLRPVRPQTRARSLPRRHLSLHLSIRALALHLADDRAAVRGGGLRRHHRNDPHHDRRAQHAPHAGAVLQLVRLQRQREPVLRAPDRRRARGSREPVPRCLRRRALLRGVPLRAVVDCRRMHRPNSRRHERRLHRGDAAQDHKVRGQRRRRGGKRAPEARAGVRPQASESAGCRHRAAQLRQRHAPGPRVHGDRPGVLVHDAGARRLRLHAAADLHTDGADGPQPGPLAAAHLPAAAAPLGHQRRAAGLRDRLPIFHRADAVPEPHPSPGHARGRDQLLGALFGVASHRPRRQHVLHRRAARDQRRVAVAREPRHA